jgi:hypothetical protein
MAAFFWRASSVTTTTAIAPVAAIRRHPGKLYLALGIALVLVGPILWMIQIQAKLFWTPWYAPALATAGVGLVLLSVLLRPTIWRIAALVLCCLPAAGQWYFLLSVAKVPAYTGPVSPGAPFPAFNTTLADGTRFDQDSLKGEQNTVLVFFRGHW